MQPSVPYAQITYYKNQKDLYQAVRNGEIDVALQNKNVFQDDRFKHGFVDLIMTHTIVEYPRRYAYYMVKAEPYHKLVAIIDRYLAGVDCSSLVSHYERSEDELILRYNEQKHQKKLLVSGAIGSSLLLVMLSIAYLNHRRFSAKLAASLELVQHQKVKLKKSEEKYRGLFDNTRDALMTLEPPSWKFASGNQATVEMFRANDEDDFISHSPWELSPEKQPDGSASIEKSRDMIETALRDGFHFFEWTHQRIGGEEFPADVLLTRIDEGGEKVMLQASVRDITERKRAEEDRAKLETQLQQAQKMESVGLLAGGVAHDFNNLLTIILLNTHLALMKSDQTQPVNEHLMSIESAAKSSADLTRQLLAFARKQIIAPTVLDLNAVVPDMIKMLKRLIGENIDLYWQPATVLWPVKMDLSQIVQIMTNLCVNARDSITGVGKITIETANCCLDEHNCFVMGEYEYVQIVVSDTGCGMDKVTQDHIFEPFFTTKGVGKGTGLGLATVYGIVKQNSGFIEVSSELGTGTIFKIYLPRHWGKVEQASNKGAQKPDPHGHETILLVEDEKDILDVATIILETLGYTVLAANSPSKAISLIKEHAGEIQLLITDVIMPEENGMALSKKLLCLYPQLKCLFMSGYTADIIASHGVLDEGLHFIQKPLTLPALAAKVREVLDNQ